MISNCVLLKTNAFGDALYHKFGVFILNVFLTPVYLVIWSLTIYIWPCLANFVSTCCFRCMFTMECVKNLLLFTDDEFQCNEKNAGKAGAQWIRLQNVTVPRSVLTRKSTNDSNAPEHVGRLFNHISPNDIVQGQLGDCWLLAALATLSERPQLIQNCFLTSSFSYRGKYRIRLYDNKTKAFQIITIDDNIPCDKYGVPIYTGVTANEMWPLLLEKAFAKMRGGYANLNGGLPLDAMQTMTGYIGEHIFIQNAKDVTDTDRIFSLLKKCHQNQCIMACGSRGVDKTREEGRNTVQGSVVGGHAYSILGVYEPRLTNHKIRLLRLRNPWGSFEWKGDWSDNSSKWNDYKGVALEIGKPPDVDDGVFYICWDDFIQHFNIIDVLYPQTHISDLHITIHEEMGPTCGPVLGCVLGFSRFWCLCQGMYTLWFERSSNRLKKQIYQVGTAEANAEADNMI